MTRPKFPWTAARVAELRQSHAAGLSPAAIAKALGIRSADSVYRKLWDLGLAGPAKPPKPARAADPRIAASKALAETIRGHVAARMTAAEIARTLGVTEATVRGHAKRMDLSIVPAKRTKPGLHIGRVERGTARATPVPARSIGVIVERAERHLVTGCRFDQLDDTICHWPEGDPRAPEFRFCGRARGDNPRHPYCTGHLRLAFETTAERTARLREERDLRADSQPEAIAC